VPLSNSDAVIRFGVTAEPDLRVSFFINPRDEFVLLGCDGLWSRYNKVSTLGLFGVVQLNLTWIALRTWLRNLCASVLCHTGHF
jgi:serine/threonine protein phosphatase PrpC